MKRLDRACGTSILRGIDHLRINVSARNDIARVAGIRHNVSFSAKFGGGGLKSMCDVLYSRALLSTAVQYSSSSFVYHRLLSSPHPTPPHGLISTIFYTAPIKPSGSTPLRNCTMPFRSYAGIAEYNIRPAARARSPSNRNTFCCRPMFCRTASCYLRILN